MRRHVIAVLVGAGVMAAGVTAWRLAGRANPASGTAEPGRAGPAEGRLVTPEQVIANPGLISGTLARATEGLATAPLTSDEAARFSRQSAAFLRAFLMPDTVETARLCGELGFGMPLNLTGGDPQKIRANWAHLTERLRRCRFDPTSARVAVRVGDGPFIGPTPDTTVNNVTITHPGEDRGARPIYQVILDGSVVEEDSAHTAVTIGIWMLRESNGNFRPVGISNYATPIGRPQVKIPVPAPR